MDTKTVEKYVKLCRKLGVTELKIGDFELKLSDNPPPKSPYKENKERKSEAFQPHKTVSGLTEEEENLFWSAGGIPFENGVVDA